MNMRLNHQPFMAIKNGTKKIEVRLNDEKRARLEVGDTIQFTDLKTGATLATRVLELEKFPTFQALFEKYSGEIIGSPENESVAALDKENLTIYSRERESLYGALAIRIEMI